MVQDQPMAQVDVQAAHVEVGRAPVTPPVDWRIPERPMDAHNLAVAIGLPATHAIILVSIWAIFTIANGDAGLGWGVVLLTWSAYLLLMAVLWFAMSTER